MSRAQKKKLARANKAQKATERNMRRRERRLHEMTADGSSNVSKNTNSSIVNGNSDDIIYDFGSLSI
jgi:hypothetical protein